MRDLDSINGAARSTKFVFTLSLIIPIFTGCGAWALAAGAAPNEALRENLLALLGLGISSIAIIAFPIPYIFRWNWETKYFGAALLCLSSAAIVGVYPILCIAQYSALPLFVRVMLLFLECALIVRWCRRFPNVYKKIYFEKSLFSCIYIEEQSAVYYSQQADKRIIEKFFKLEQFPHSKYFLLSALVAFSLAPFATATSRFVAIPFIHIFLAIFSIPLSLMFLGLATRGWLVFYFYPMKIKSETNKPVYIDMSSRPAKCLALEKNHKKRQ